MKINWEYIKDLLECFEESDQRALTIFDLQKKGFDFDKDEDNFIFHMLLLCDEGLINSESGSDEVGTRVFGMYKNSRGYTVSSLPLRLTMGGHEFVANLRNREVWSKLKSNLKDQGFSAIVTLAKGLAIGFAKKKVESILNDNA